MLAWLNRLPAKGVDPRAHDPAMLLSKTPPRQNMPFSSLPSPQNDFSSAKEQPLWSRLLGQLKNIFSSVSQTHAEGKHMFILPEQKNWKERVETYAESPFEKELFSLRKKPDELVVTKAWIKGIKSNVPLTQEAALTLFKAYLTYTDKASLIELSPHSQLKLIMFSSHLSEGFRGKALLYEAVLSLALPQLLEFSDALQKDFAIFPSVLQALILKQISARRKKLAKEQGIEEEHLKTFNKLFKNLVIMFYTSVEDSSEEILQQQEKIRPGFMKIKPVEMAYKKSLEEIEQRYRLKLRQLKRQRTQKIAEAEEERQRRIELLYDSLENDLIAGLKELSIDPDKLQTK